MVIDAAFATLSQLNGGSNGAGVKKNKVLGSERAFGEPVGTVPTYTARDDYMHFAHSRMMSSRIFKAVLKIK